MNEKLAIVSACLAGVNCRYDCKDVPNIDIIEMVKNKKAIPVCPEQLGGLTTPRPPAEEIDDMFTTIHGDDVTEKFKKGANEAVKIALLMECDRAFLKSKSPMCGVGRVYDGTFTGTLLKKDGLFTRLLKKHDIETHEVI